MRSCCCFSVDKKQLWISVFFIAILGFFCYRRSLKDLDTKVSNWHWLSLIIINWLLTEHTWTDWRHRQKTGGPSNQCSAPTMQIWKMKNPPTLTQQYYISYDFSSDIYCFISTHIKWILLHIKKKKKPASRGWTGGAWCITSMWLLWQSHIFFLHINILLTKNTPVRNINRSCGRNQGLDSSWYRHIYFVLFSWLNTPARIKTRKLIFE